MADAVGIPIPMQSPVHYSWEGDTGQAVAGPRSPGGLLLGTADGRVAISRVLDLGQVLRSPTRISTRDDFFSKEIRRPAEKLSHKNAIKIDFCANFFPTACYSGKCLGTHVGSLRGGRLRPTTFLRAHF